MTAIAGDARDVLPGFPSKSVQTCVTSPPYYRQRDYGIPNQIGLEPTPDEYVENLVSVFRDVRRILRGDGTLWLNLGDTYNAYNSNRGTGGVHNRGARHTMLPTFDRGLTDPDTPNKSLLGMPWRVASAMIRDGWILRSEIIWHKPSAKPSGGRDRPLTRHETVFLFARTTRTAYLDPTIRGYGTVWTLNAARNGRNGNTAPMSRALAERCIVLGSRIGDTVLDPFHGGGTTGEAAAVLGRDYLGVEINPTYLTDSQP